MELMQWLTETGVGRFVFTVLASMIPITELRVGIPFGVGLGLAYPVAFVAAVIGNVVPVPFLVLYVRRVFAWLRVRLPRLGGMVDALEKKAHLKGRKVSRYQYLGLYLLVAVPLPGTGAWTGSLAAAFLDMPLRKALPSIFFGVLTAGLIMTALTAVGVDLFSTAVA